MCGIAGFIGFRDNARLATNANRIQAHRGPDNQSIWCDDYIALAHQRLSIIDINERSNQPFEKHNLVIVFNGEIYNYRELKSKHDFYFDFITNSDTEVVLEMYREYKEKCLDYLIGMFSFAIYNKTTRELFVARDHFGIKPLFYTKIKTGFAFSSELKTLVGIRGFNKTINAKSLVSSLNYLWVAGNDTMFEGCYKLPAAHYLKIINGEPKITRYWSTVEGTSDKTEEELVKELQTTIADSVKRHMVADVGVSSFLSGGLDSSLISVLAEKSTPYLSTFTIATTTKDKKIEKSEDEKYANKVAKLYQLDHQTIEINSNIVDDLPYMVKMLDEPIGDPAAINTYLICNAARKQGVKVLLSGMGADEIYGGYRRHKATLLAQKFNILPGFIKTPVRKLVDLLPVKIMGRGFKFGRWAKKFLTFALLPFEQSYMRSYSYYNPDQLKKLLKPEFKPAVELVQEEHARIFNSRYSSDMVNRMCYMDTRMFMLGLNLTYTDRASMAASVEVRTPFIDKEVITKAMQIPGNLKIKNGESKYILKKAAEKYLPKEVIYRSKASFGAPIRSWISNELKPLVDEILSRQSVEKRGILNYNIVKRIIDNDRKGIEDNAYQIYQLLTLELWCREYVD